MNNLLLNNVAEGPGTKLYFAKVVRFYPSSNTVDAIEVDGGIRFPNAAITCSTPTNFFFGERYFPSHDGMQAEIEFINPSADIYCVAAFLENDYNNAVILGFLFPKETVLSISEYGLHIYRHESDVMWMIRSDGTMQIYHPSGSIIKIGDDTTNELTDDREQAGMYPAKADGFNVRSAPEYNSRKTSNLFIGWYKGQKIKLDSDGNIIVSTENAEGIVQTTLTMTPDGNVTVTATNDVTVNAARDVNVTANRSINLHSDSHANLFVGGNLDASIFGNLTASVVGDAQLDVTGNAGVNCSKLIDIKAVTGINITATAGPIRILAPASSVIIGGTSPVIVPIPWKYSFN